MKTEYISGTQALTQRLKELKDEKERYEVRLSNDVKDVYALIQNPAPIIKRAVRDLAQDRSVQADLITVGINTAANFLVDKLSGKVAGAGWITSLLSKLMSGIKKQKDN
jgi:hypothetical protein